MYLHLVKSYALRLHDDIPRVANNTDVLDQAVYTVTVTDYGIVGMFNVRRAPLRKVISSVTCKVLTRIVPAAYTLNVQR